jgi:hypothetical protein
MNNERAEKTTEDTEIKTQRGKGGRLTKKLLIMLGYREFKQRDQVTGHGTKGLDCSPVLFATAFKCACIQHQEILLITRFYSVPNSRLH